MSAIRLQPRAIETVWGRRDLPASFAASAADAEGPIGEIIFDSPPGSDPELLVKFLFTAEKLSIQVHPDDEAARAAGGARGKDEAWIVFAAEAGATIGLGLERELSKAEL